MLTKEEASRIRWAALARMADPRKHSAYLDSRPRRPVGSRKAKRMRLRGY